MQHPSKPLAKTRQERWPGAQNRGFISGAAFRTPRRPWARCAGARRSQPPAGRGTSSRDLFRGQLAGH